MLEEIIESAKNQFAERLASPLIGSFLVSWCLWNYKFIVILLSSATVSQTFRLIETEAFPDAYSILFRGLLWPLASAAFYIFCYPYIDRQIYEVTRNHDKQRNDIKQKYDGLVRLSVDESRQIRVEAARADAQHKEEVDRLNKEIQELKEIQRVLTKSPEKETDTSPVTSTPGVSKLTLSEYKILALFGGSEDVIEENTLIHRTGVGSLEAKYLIGELARRGLISGRPVADRSGYAITHEGRRELLLLQPPDVAEAQLLKEWKP